jgi:hypothetical protein
MNARTNTPDRIHSATSRTITMKRCCNGCGEYVGDVDDRDVDEHGNLTDVRGECDNCRPVVELEAVGCKTWQLTPRNLARVDHELDRLGVFTKQFTETDDDGHVVTIGLRIGAKPGHVVALFGDWIIRHPDGGFSVHKAPAERAA